MVQIKHDCKIIFWSINVKKIISILSVLILVGCCDPSSIDCNSSYLPNQFWKGFGILLFFVLGISLLSAIIFKIKNKNEDIYEFLDEHGWIFICIFFILTIVWAIAVVWFNGVVFLKYLGVA